MPDRMARRTENGAPVALAIVGATASGKTALSLELARRLGAEILCCDSMQIYRGMDIGTAKPTPQERAAVPHHLFDLVTPDRQYSAADYAEDALRTVLKLTARGVLPLFCGGTGLYLEAVRTGRHRQVCAGDPALRESLLRQGESEEGRAALYAELRAVDPASAEAMHPNNLRRVCRALEIYRLTGRSKSDWDAQTRALPPALRLCAFYLQYEDRGLLYRRIEERVDRMLADGLLDEVARLRGAGWLSPDTTAGQAIGYKELFACLDGRCGYDEAVAALKTATRHYAKRQITWFSAQPYLIPLRADRDGRPRPIGELADEAMQTISVFLAAQGCSPAAHDINF